MIALQDRQITPAWSNVLGLLTLLLALAACIFVLRLSDGMLALYRGVAASPVEAGPAEISIAGESLRVPAALMRYPLAGPAAQTGPIQTRRIELAFTWPALAPLTPGRSGIHLAVIAEHDPFSDKERFERLFAPRFASGQVAGPDGLSGRHMEAGSGYGGEIVYYQPALAGPGGGGPFYYARCGVPQADPVALSCLRTLRLAPGLQASYRFDAALLGEWRLIERAILDLIARMRAG